MKLPKLRNGRSQQAYLPSTLPAASKTALRDREALDVGNPGGETRPEDRRTEPLSPRTALIVGR